MTEANQNATDLRTCLRAPIAAIHDAARLLDAAVTAHLRGETKVAEDLIKLADMPEVWSWTDSVWGKKSEYVQVRTVLNAPPHLSEDQRRLPRMPDANLKRLLLERDGYHCRFCGIPVIRPEIRRRMRLAYPYAVRWGRTNDQQHAAFQAMWVQYDHLLPHARGGATDIENMVITCAACNYGRMNYTLAEVGLADPRARVPVRSLWDGLERFE